MIRRFPLIIESQPAMYAVGLLRTLLFARNIRGNANNVKIRLIAGIADAVVAPDLITTSASNA